MEVSETSVHITGFYPGSFPEGFCGYYSGCGRTTFTMVQGIAGAFLVRIPFSYFMSRIPGISLFYIGLATPASTVIQIALCLIYFVYTEKKVKKTEIAET